MVWRADGLTPSTFAFLLVCLLLFCFAASLVLYFPPLLPCILSVCVVRLSFSLKWLVCASFDSSVLFGSRRSVLGWGERLRLCLYWVGEPRALQRNAGARDWLVCNGNGVSLGTASGVWERVVGGSAVSVGMTTDSTPRATVGHLGAETHDMLSAVSPPAGTSPPRPNSLCSLRGSVRLVASTGACCRNHTCVAT